MIEAFQQDLLQSESGFVLTFIDFALADASQNSSTAPPAAAEPADELPTVRPAGSRESSGLSGLMNIGSTSSAPGVSAGVSDQEGENDGANDELVSVALELLLALLEGEYVSHVPTEY